MSSILSIVSSAVPVIRFSRLPAYSVGQPYIQDTFGECRRVLPIEESEDVGRCLEEAIDLFHDLGSEDRLTWSPVEVCFGNDACLARSHPFVTSRVGDCRFELFSGITICRRQGGAQETRITPLVDRGSVISRWNPAGGTEREFLFVSQIDGGPLSSVWRQAQEFHGLVLENGESGVSRAA